MKKILCIITVLVVMFLAACGKEEEFTGVSEGLRYTEMYRTITVSPEGVFFKDNDDMLYFRPAETREAMLLCYDPNCIHEPASDVNPDPVCRAALFPDARTYIAYYEGNIYYFVNDDMFSHKIYKMAVDGPGRTLIAEIPYTAEIPGGMVFYEDKIYYYVAEKIRVGEMGQLESKAYVLEYDLKSGEYRVVTPVLTDFLLGDGMQVTKDYLYMRMGYPVGDHNEIYIKRYNLKTAEEEVVTSPEEYKTHRLVRAYDDYYVYTNYGENNNIGVINLKTGEDTVLVERFCNDLTWSEASGNGILYFEQEEKENTLIQSGVFFYNMQTGEMTDITEAATEYDIRSYDAYNGVFICGSGKNVSVISEEEVLGK